VTQHELATTTVSRSTAEQGFEILGAPAFGTYQGRQIHGRNYVELVGDWK
jgi:hypothetical protein